MIDLEEARRLGGGVLVPGDLQNQNYCYRKLILKLVDEVERLVSALPTCAVCARPIDPDHVRMGQVGHDTQAHTSCAMTILDVVDGC